jgi:hypothetical protein
LEHAHDLANAMQLHGTLDAFEVLRLHTTTTAHWPRGTIQQPAGALVSGAAPALRHRALHEISAANMTDEDMEALVAMVETRATLPACRPLEILEPCSNLGRLPMATRRRLVRALLPSVTEMAFPWDKAYEQDVRTHGAPHVTTCDVTHAQKLSEQVLEAMPLLEDLSIIAPKEHEAALQPFLAALNRRTAFRRLPNLEPMSTP